MSTHPVIGRIWRSGAGHDYYCSSYDPAIGYWMELINPNVNSKYTSERTNISVAAINRSFFEVARDNYNIAYGLG